MLSAKQTEVELNTVMKRVKKGKAKAEGGLQVSKSKQSLHLKIKRSAGQGKTNLRHVGEDNLR